MRVRDRADDVSGFAPLGLGGPDALRARERRRHRGLLVGLPPEVVDDGGRDGGGLLFGGGVRGLELRRREALARAGRPSALDDEEARRRPDAGRDGPSLRAHEAAALGRLEARRRQRRAQAGLPRRAAPLGGLELDGRRLARKCVIWRRHDGPVVLELADDVALTPVRACRDVIVLSDTSQSPTDTVGYVGPRPWRKAA